MPLAEHDKPLRVFLSQHFSFNSRAPRGARPTTLIPFLAAAAFQFTCPSRSTTRRIAAFVFVNGVSIHVPLAEHDLLSNNSGRRFQVSIHVPLAEHDSIHAAHGGIVSTFQFTCPSRSTTSILLRILRISSVSIHVPLAEHDVMNRVRFRLDSPIETLGHSLKYFVLVE